MGMMSRRKGCSGEREVVHLLLPIFPDARTKRAGGESAVQDRGRDILGTPGLCVQVMRARRPAIERKFREACNAALPGETPVAFTRQDRGPWLVTLPANVLIELIAAGRLMVACREVTVEQLAGASGDKPAPPRGPGFPAITVPNGPETTPARPPIDYSKVLESTAEAVLRRLRKMEDK